MNIFRIKKTDVTLESQHQPLHQFIRRLALYWGIAATLIFVLAIVTDVLFGRFLQNVQADTELVNTATLQRMYSQRIAIDSLLLMDAQDDAERLDIQQRLQENIDAMLEGHNQLAHARQLRSEFENLYYAEPVLLDTHIHEYIDTAQRFLDSATTDSISTADLDWLATQSFSITTDLSTAAALYEDQSILQQQNLRNMNLARIAVVVVIIAFQGWFVLRPVIQRLTQKADNLVHEIELREQVETLLQEHQQFLYQITGAIPDVVYVTNMKTGEKPFTNRSIGSLLGYDSYKALTITDDLLHSDDKLAFQKAQQQFMLSYDTELFDHEYRLLNNDNQWCWIRSREKVLEWDSDGKPKLKLTTYQDITAHKLLEEQQIKLTLEQERRQLLSDFITNTAHELKTPLSIIKSSVYVLQRVEDPQRKQQKADAIDKQVDHMNHMVNQMSEMVQLEHHDSINLLPRDMNNLIHATLPELKQMAAAKQLEIVYTTEAESVPLRLDDYYMQRAIREIVENAVRYSPENHAITITLKRNISEAILSVSNEGEGIAADDLPHLFEHFYKANKARTADGSGSGMGLAFVKRIAELHRGRVAVESSGQVTTFSLYLPLALKAEFVS